MCEDDEKGKEMKTERVIIPVSFERESRIPHLKHLIPPQDQLRRDSMHCVSPPLASSLRNVTGCKLRLETPGEAYD
ncbi:hypothetical protein E2C01_062171 [Portunus trituberculatus]|uniref:Uncharacterized protein n=1 Tax=Portunus trituberculatus TaxID=210409 RepID=A0A5B7HA89_PORTR|nr:hypothetical protein [Portunus trituberculatus]